MLEGQMAAIAAIPDADPRHRRAAEAAAERLGATGRLVFVGAGTSGRLAVQDGTELHPTFGWPMERMVFLMAGGLGALTEAYEGAEDDAKQAAPKLPRQGSGRRTSSSASPPAGARPTPSRRSSRPVGWAR
jgi:N-acetylmuramic acid 6-phosphate etherase